MTPTPVLRGWRGAWRHPPSLCVAIFHTQLYHTHTTLSHTHIFVTHKFATHHLSHTSLSHTIFHTHRFHTPSLSHTFFHTPLCHTPSFTHHFVTHLLSHTALSHTFFHTPLCHTPSGTHNFVTPSFTHTHTTLSYTTVQIQLFDRSSTTSFVYPSFLVPLELFVSAYWKKLTCGVIRPFNFEGFLHTSALWTVTLAKDVLDQTQLPGYG